LGLTFDKLGVGIAQRWNLPEKIISAMSIGPIQTDRPLLQVERLAALAELSNQLCEVVSNAGSVQDCTQELNALLRQHRGYLQLEEAELLKLFELAQDSAERRYRALFGSATRDCRFARTLSLRSSERSYSREGGNTPAPAAESGAACAVPGKEASPQSATQRVARAKPQILRLELGRPLESESSKGTAQDEASWLELETTHGRVSREASTTKDLELLTRELLTKLAQYLRVPRIILMRTTPSRRELVVVGGMGDDIDGLCRSLSIPLQAARSAADPFSQAFHARRDSMIDDAFASNITRRLPQCYYEAIGSTRLAILSCGVLGVDPLVLLMDVEPPGQLPSRQQIDRLGDIRLTLARIAPA
jgi:hypothetical protein